MKKPKIAKLTRFVIFGLLIIFVYGTYRKENNNLEYLYYKIFVSDISPMPNPNLYWEYPEGKYGYFQFNPETIMNNTVYQGNDISLTPLLIDDINQMDTKYTDITWNQTDFMNIANAISKEAWNEPVDLNRWKVYNIYFGGGCKNDFVGFSSFYMTYFRINKTGLANEYIARHITIYPDLGVGIWAGDWYISTPFIFGWRSIEYRNYTVSADKAVRIANGKVGKEERLNNNTCMVSVSPVEQIFSFHGTDWLVDYHNITAPVNVIINPYSGKVGESNPIFLINT